MHVVDNIECPAEHLKYLFKLFSVLNIRIIYDDTFDNKYVPESVGIICINCGKFIGCLLDNKNIEKSITSFVTNMVFQNIGLFWIIHSHKNLSFHFQNHFPSWILNGAWNNTMICS